VRSSDALVAIAQVAVTLAGFSGVAVVLGSRSRGEWSAPERLAFGALLRPSLAVTFWSLIPLIVEAGRVAEPMLWRLVSLAYLIYVSALMGFVVIPQARLSGALATAGGRWFIALTLLGNVALLSSNALWLGEAWPYLACLLAALLVSVGAFTQLLRGRE
jgi:hypothetical protein